MRVQCGTRTAYSPICAYSAALDTHTALYARTVRHCTRIQSYMRVQYGTVRTYSPKYIFVHAHEMFVCLHAHIHAGAPGLGAAWRVSPTGFSGGRVCVRGDGWSLFCAPRCGESVWCARDTHPGRSRFDGDAHSAASALRWVRGSLNVAQSPPLAPVLSSSEAMGTYTRATPPDGGSSSSL
jgi:hypothetical protein